MKTKTLVLADVRELNSQTVSELQFKEPTGGIYLDLGEPRIWTKTKDGQYFLMENDATIKVYVEQCLVNHEQIPLLRHLSLRDARAARELVMSFFTEGDAEKSATN